MTKTREIVVSSITAGSGYPGPIPDHRLVCVERTERTKELVLSKPSGGTQTVSRTKVCLIEHWEPRGGYVRTCP